MCWAGAAGSGVENNCRREALGDKVASSLSTTMEAPVSLRLLGRWKVLDVD